MEKFNQFALAVTFLFVHLQADAAINLKPGLWEIQSKIKSGGKQIDPQAEMQKAMAKMSPEQRKQMSAMLKSRGADLGAKGVKVCYTKEFLNRDDATLLNNQGLQNCESKVKTHTSNKIVVDFKCKDGTVGSSDWTMPDTSHFVARVVSTNAKGIQSDMDLNGTFVKTDCGTVKPFTLPAAKK